jgi:hypothetical protein
VEFWATLRSVKGSTWRAPAVAAACAGVFAGAALAANSNSFLDPGGDVASSPDITAVSVANDDAGIVTVKLTISNRAAFTANDEAAIGLDTDQNPDTGSVFYGAEYELDLTGNLPSVLQAASGGGYNQITAPASYSASFTGGVATFTFKAADFGISSGFNLYAVADDRNGIDAAPDIRMSNFQLAGGTQAPALSSDRRAPLDIAINSTGTHGKTALLVYFAADGRGETSDSLVVYKGKKVLKRFNFLLADTSPFLTYVARWKVPKKTKGKLRFCVSSVDRAGNKSNTSCAQLRIK